MTEFRGYSCWSTAAVRSTIFSDVGAIGIDDDALFLATHTSLPIENIGSSRTVVDEEAVLDCMAVALDENKDKNLVVAVTGPSGSGKSHLVRWVRARLSDLSRPDAVLVYVPRRVTTLREILLLLLEQLGGELAAELTEKVNAAVPANMEPRQLAEALLNRIWESLKWNPPRPNLEHSEVLLPAAGTEPAGRERGGIAGLLGNEAIRAHLTREDGTLAQLAQSILGRRGQETTDKPSFTAEDFDFGRLSGVRQGLPDHAATALRVLTRDSGRTAAAAIFNAERDAAAQAILGMREGLGLHEVFTDARRRLRDQQLVLMFEDLALMDLVEGAILDEFANHGDATHAALRVVFAVTDDKYATLQETIEGRVTHRFRVGEVLLGAADADRRDLFVAGYLNAARVGRDALVAARQEEGVVPNKCIGCDFKDECHRGFGSVDTPIGPVGLYPYNRNALAHGVARQSEERHRINRVLTPRVVIDFLVHEFLVRSHDDLSSGQMPSEELVSVLVDGSAERSPADVVTEYPEGSTEFNRLFRTRSYWFEQGHETEDVAIAFDLPLTSRESPVVQSEPPATDATRPPEPGPVSTLLPSEVAAVQAWEQGAEFDRTASPAVRQLLRTMTQERLDLERHLIHSTSPQVRDHLRAALGDASFRIEEGSGSPSATQLVFDLPRSNASARVLLAALWYRDHKHWDFESPTRKWKLPGTRNPDKLPVELECLLDRCAAAVEGSLVATLFGSGVDPVAIASRLGVLSRVCVESARGGQPQAWVEVVQEARRVNDSGVVGEVISAFAGARQSSRAQPAAIDSVRTRHEDSTTLEPTEELARHFPVLAQRWTALQHQIARALQPTSEELAGAARTVIGLHDGEVGSEYGSLLRRCGTAANAESVFPAELNPGEFEDATQRIGRTSLDLDMWADFLAMEQQVTIEDLLAVMPEAGALLTQARDLQFVSDALEAIRELLDSRMAERGVARSPDKERLAAIQSRDELLEAISALGNTRGRS